MSNEIRVLLSALDPHRRDLCAAVLALCAPEFEAPAPPTQVFLSSLYQKLCGADVPRRPAGDPGADGGRGRRILPRSSPRCRTRRTALTPASTFCPCRRMRIPGSRVEGQYRLFTDRPCGRTI